MSKIFKSVIAIILVSTFSLLASEGTEVKKNETVFSAKSQSGTVFYSAPQSSETTTISWSKFAKKFKKAWFITEEDEWKEVDIQSDADRKLEELEEIQWTTALEFSTHLEDNETKSLSKLESKF